MTLLFPRFWQAALADRLSAVLLQLSPDVARTYFVVFFRALREEWFGIDRLRLDKYMLLIRRVLRQLFRRLHDADWCSFPWPGICGVPTFMTR